MNKSKLMNKILSTMLITATMLSFSVNTNTANATYTVKDKYVYDADSVNCDSQNRLFYYDTDKSSAPFIEKHFFDDDKKAESIKASINKKKEECNVDVVKEDKLYGEWKVCIYSSKK